jgi:hypothetical protein
MFGERKINLQLTQRTREFLDRFKAKSKLDSPILGISWSRVSNESNERWTIGLYDRKDVREGWLGIAPEFEFIVIQEWVLDELDDKVLDFDDARGVVTIEAAQPS